MRIHYPPGFEILAETNIERRGAVAVHRALEKAGELAERSTGDVRSCAGARPRRLWDQNVSAVCVESRDEGDGHASGRVVGDDRRRQWLSEVRHEEGANAGPVGVGRGVERALAADEIVAQLSMSRVGVAGDGGVAGNGKLAFIAIPPPHPGGVLVTD